MGVDGLAAAVEGWGTWKRAGPPMSMSMLPPPLPHRQPAEAALLCRWGAWQPGPPAPKIGIVVKTSSCEGGELNRGGGSCERAEHLE